MQLIKRTLVSVFDKAGIVDFVRQLVDSFGIEILSTGGMPKFWEKRVSHLLKSRIILDFPRCSMGRVKTFIRVSMEIS